MLTRFSLASALVVVLALAAWMTGKYAVAAGCNKGCNNQPSNTCTGADQNCTTSMCSNCYEPSQDIEFYNVLVYSGDPGNSMTHNTPIDCMDVAACGYGMPQPNQSCYLGNCRWLYSFSCQFCAITGIPATLTFPSCIDDGCDEQLIADAAPAARGDSTSVLVAVVKQ
jgi:hypothetical protein